MANGKTKIDTNGGGGGGGGDGERTTRRDPRTSSNRTPSYSRIGSRVCHNSVRHFAPPPLLPRRCRPVIILSYLSGACDCGVSDRRPFNISARAHTNICRGNKIPCETLIDVLCSSSYTGRKYCVAVVAVEVTVVVVVVVTAVFSPRPSGFRRKPDTTSRRRHDILARGELWREKIGSAHGA